MNIEDIREYCLSLAEVTEDQPFGDDNITFRIDGKIFLCLWLGDDNLTSNSPEPHFAVKLTPERNIELREKFPAVTPAWHWNKKHWSDIFYERLSDEQVKSWIEESYQLLSKKKKANKK